ncbi:Multidrug resistance protein MdtA [Xanthomonas hydrangeae]|nr:Multidrug resistance protein MdtA [Xanthomonas hydrangeae]CAD7733276.1 Multidrug resistance protein MdtA [Xanthomonas hydrangeae]CAD7746523.1 Multidrug resistance protein MdtA [Xanthomonas hydrangeae]CAD7746525.1 Multidrug resistance protein MdtA [Xanthomonas hydrangeae]
MNTSADLLKQLRIDRQRPAAPEPARRGGWIIAAVVIVILLAAAAWWFTRRPVAKVRTAPVVAISAGSSSASVLDASGYVVARRMATVSAQVTGKVREVMIEEGMRVEQGQVMATLDPLDAEAQRTLSASQLSAARSQVDNMQAQLAVANADATRLQSLVGAQLVSRSQYEQATAQRDALRAQLQNAQRNVRVASDQLAISAIR